ncbi:cytochrome P450 CYP82D47-like isoform X2 [Amaranthus tricolor]|uniref:cytochrome P450 CYP82D47-like isoform X2 n=1 Tax=Amaranthus tricolor TaxID=29722 RepID=UPI0025835C32|nr:cytochrome P450 CYP82D47-like isoform X2 [Amaranthus tricolor]
MDLQFPQPNQLAAAATSVLALLFFLYCLLRWKNNTHNMKQEPPYPSGSWPVIGHFLLLGKLPHITLGHLADQYGPIFMIKLGFKRALVVSNAEIAKECLGANDKVFVNRPHKICAEHLGYNFAMLAFSPYGKYWLEMRKIITVEFLSNHRIEMFKHIRITEVKSAMKVIHEHCNKNRTFTTCSDIFDMKQWFSDITMNTIVRLVSGQSLKECYQGEEYDRYARAIREFLELAGAFVLADALPFLRWFDIGGYEKKMKKVAIQMDCVTQKWLEEHKKGRGSNEVEQKQDFMDVMLGIFEAGGKKSFIHQNLILAGADTIGVTLTWALSLLLNNKDILKKAQAELDTVVGNERHVEESDLKSLVYLQAILKESMRLYPPGPLSVPREAITDCTVGGYHIQAGTQLYINLYKLQRDPKVWENPLEFHPERFLTTHKDYDVKGKHFEILPFGTGRRICPGITFSLQTMLFILANLLHEFDISVPSHEAVDMTESFGLSNIKATPLEVILKSRLPHKL